MLLLGFILKFLKKSLNRFCHVPPVPLVPPVSLVPPVPLVPPVSPVSLVPLVPLVPALPILPAFSTLSPVLRVPPVPQFKISFALFRALYRLKKLFSLWCIKENDRLVFCIVLIFNVEAV